MTGTEGTPGCKPEILANFENGGRLSELLMVGNIATQFPGEVLAYEPWSGKIIGHAEASSKLSYRYRDGWRLRGLDVLGRRSRWRGVFSGRICGVWRMGVVWGFWVAWGR